MSNWKEQENSLQATFEFKNFREAFAGGTVTEKDRKLAAKIDDIFVKY